MKQLPSQIDCPTCGFAENPIDARFCGQCAHVLPIVCPNCGALNPSGFRFCGQCATAFNTTPVLASTRRVVTVLFADVCNYTTLTNKIGAERMYLLLDPCLRRLAETIQRFEGSIDKFTGDGLMAVFGLPIALEQHAIQATNAALAMFDELAMYNAEIAQHSPDLSFEIRIGLASGEVIAGRLGSDRHSDTTVIGEAVNLAARLQQSADPNAIMVSEVTAVDIAPLFEIEEPILTKFKGFDHAIRAFGVQSKRTNGNQLTNIVAQTPFVGRDQECQRLTTILRSLNNGLGGVIALTGAAGIGKTRLTSEVLANLRDYGMKIYGGECSTATRNVPYSAFLGVVNRMCGIVPSDSREHIRAKIRAAVANSPVGALIDLVPYIEYLLSIDLVDEAFLERVNNTDPTQLRKQVFLALREMFVSEARNHPVVLVLDDLQWIDPVSAQLIEYLAQAVDDAPLLLYMIAREDEAPHVQGLFDRIFAIVQQRGQLIPLEVLSDQASIELARYLLPNASQTVLEHITKQAEGMPFYIEQLARHAADSKIDLTTIDEKDITATTLPLSLNTLMRGRFDRLPLHLAQTLSQAAIIGRQFQQRILQEISHANDLPQQLEALRQRGFITLANNVDDTWRFQHVLIHETVYASMLASQQAQLHEQVGLILEAQPGERLDEHIDQLAYHFSRSNRRDKAIQYALQAAQKAAEHFANEDALRMFDEIERLINGSRDQFPAELATLNHERGTIFNLLGRHEQARTAYQQAILLAQEHRLWDGSRLATLYRALATSAERQGYYDQAMIYLKQAREALGDGDLLDHARIDADAGWIALAQGNLPEAERLLSTALSFAELHEHEALQALIANRLAGVYRARGDLRSAHGLVTQSLRMSRRANDQLAVAKSLNSLGMIANDQLAWDMAEAYYSESMGIYKQLGDVHGHIRAAYNHSVTALMRGKLNQALELAQKALVLAQQVGDNAHIGLCHVQQGEIAFLVQDFGRARRSLLQAECTLRRLQGLTSKRADVAELLARLAYVQQRPKLAQRFAHRAIRLAQGEDHALAQFHAQRIHGFLLFQSDPERATEVFDELEQAEVNALEKGRLYAAWSEALQTTDDLWLAHHYRDRADQMFDVIALPQMLRHFAGA